MQHEVALEEEGGKRSFAALAIGSPNKNGSRHSERNNIEVCTATPHDITETILTLVWRSEFAVAAKLRHNNIDPIWTTLGVFATACNG